MKPETLNNLSRNARESLDGSTTENNSLSSDSDIEDLSCGTSDQRSIVQGLRKTIKRNKTKINDLVAKLTIAEIHLANEKEKAIYRDDLIKSLKMSTDLANQTKDLSIKQMQSKINELENFLDLSKSRSLVEDIDKDTSGMIEPINQYKKIIDDLNFEILKSESKLQEKADKLVDLEEKAEKFKNIISEKEEHISRLESKIENDQAKINKLVDLEEKVKKFENIISEKEKHISRLESKIKNDQTKINKLVDLEEKAEKFENIISEKEEHISRLESKIENDQAKIKEMFEKLSKFTLDAESCQNPSEPQVFLNCTKIPSIKLITLPGCDPFAAVFEDIPGAGPGWMVIQRRIDGSFDKNIQQCFHSGCGDLSGEFWIGNAKLHKLTASRRHELYIHLVDFDDVSAFARYDDFAVQPYGNYYQLISLGKYSGNAGDALRTHLNEFQYNAWWGISDCNLNGKYYASKVELNNLDGIWWGRWILAKRVSLKSCKMLIRPKP